MPESHSTVIPALRYRNAPATIDWLCQVFGFERHAVYETAPGIIGHAELTLNGGMIMLASVKDDEHASRHRSPDDLDGVETRSAYIVVADADAPPTPALLPPAPASFARCRTPPTAAASSP